MSDETRNQPLNNIGSISPEHAATVSRLASLATDDAAFGKALVENPAAALAAKGIRITSAEADRLSQKLKTLPARGGGAAESVEVGVTVKF